MTSIIKIIRGQLIHSYSLSFRVSLAVKRLIKKRTELSYMLLRLYKLKSVINRHKAILFEECRGSVCPTCPGVDKCGTQSNTQTRQWKKLDRAITSVDAQIESVLTLGGILDEGTGILKRRLAYCQSLKAISATTELDILTQARALLLNIKNQETEVDILMSMQGEEHD